MEESAPAMSKRTRKEIREEIDALLKRREGVIGEISWQEKHLREMSDEAPLLNGGCATGSKTEPSFLRMWLNAEYQKRAEEILRSLK